MTKRRVKLSVIVMVLAIVAIVSFQSNWIYKNYKDEQRNLNLRTNVLFREAVVSCQVQRFKMDSIDLRFSPGPGAVGVLNVLKDKVRDSLFRKAKVKDVIVAVSNRNDIIYR